MKMFWGLESIRILNKEKQPHNCFEQNICNRKLDEKKGVDEKSDQKQHKKEGAQPLTNCPSHKFFYYVYFSVVQSFLLVFS